ncbi:MAG: hypothetical protein K9N23_21010 [Akkermansiaceae bacterium]|nr:hypothetical protein [Akkermansiaceae bacterium]MCF7734177.1 hypothetical protein [Akkermansiaceae bacterium]
MTKNPTLLLSGLPGAERILAGLLDYSRNRPTIDACLVRIARRRLARAGLLDPAPHGDDGAELELYAYLAHEGARAHSRYNALLRELASFEHALDHRLAGRV